METGRLSRRAWMKGAAAVSALAALGPEAASAAMQAPAGTWVLIGTRDVNFALGRDTLPVTFLAGAYTHIQLRVKGDPVFVNGLRVRFSNGEWTTLPVRGRIRNGGETRPIALPGGRRYVSVIQVLHRPTANGRGRSTIAFWGRR